MPTRLWRCKDFSLRFRRCQRNLEVSRRMPPRLWHCMDMPLEERWCNTNFRCWRKVTLSKFQRHDVKWHHSEGRWCGSNFRVMKWHNLEEKRCSLDLEGTRRCPQEINDAKYTSEMWEDGHRKWAMLWRSLHFLLRRSLIILLSNALPTEGTLKSALMTVGKLLKLDWPSFFFSCDWT